MSNLDDALFDAAFALAIDASATRRRDRARAASAVAAGALRHLDPRAAFETARPRLEKQLGERGAAGLIRQALAMEKSPRRGLATVLFTDIVGSTEMAAALGDNVWAEVLVKHNAAVRKVLAQHDGRELDTAGDGFYAVFSIPTQALAAAAALRAPLARLGVTIRAGVHTGEVAWSEGKAIGIVVSTGARVAGLAGGGDIFVTQTVHDLVAGSQLRFRDVGLHKLKGVPGETRLFALSTS